MRVFISWSGEPSRTVAEILRSYLHCMIQAVEVFMSHHDIKSGERWSLELAKELDDSTFGILCLTRSNLDSPWLLFEAGALTKHIENGACGLLIGDLKAIDVKEPLSQFQHRAFTKPDLEVLVRDINERLERPLDGEEIGRIFELWWPKIEGDYESALQAHKQAFAVAPRSTQDLLEEILSRVRNLERFPLADYAPPLPPRKALVTVLAREIENLSPEARDTLASIAALEDGDRLAVANSGLRDELELLVQHGLLSAPVAGQYMVAHGISRDAISRALSRVA